MLWCRFLLLSSPWLSICLEYEAEFLVDTADDRLGWPDSASSTPSCLLQVHHRRQTFPSHVLPILSNRTAWVQALSSSTNKSANNVGTNVGAINTVIPAAKTESWMSIPAGARALYRSSRGNTLEELQTRTMAFLVGICIWLSLVVSCVFGAIWCLSTPEQDGSETRQQEAILPRSAQARSRQDGLDEEAKEVPPVEEVKKEPESSTGVHAKSSGAG